MGQEFDSKAAHVQRLINLGKRHRGNNRRELKRAEKALGELATIMEIDNIKAAYQNAVLLMRVVNRPKPELRKSYRLEQWLERLTKKYLPANIFW